MPVLIQCQHCKRKLRVQDHLIGKNIKCPGCGTKFVAQAAEPAAAALPVVTPPTPEPLPTAIVPFAAAPAPPPPTPALPPPLPSAPPPVNEEPLEVFDPIVLDEPASGSSRKAVKVLPPAVPDSAERNPTPATVHDQLPAGNQGSPVRVFALLTGLLVVTIALGLFGGWWINRSIESARPRVQSSQ